MFTISFDTWESVCSMYFNQKEGRQRAYLQWFPFSKLSEQDKEAIKSRTFFERYIQSGFIIHYPIFWLRTDNYLQKGDGSFRNSSLLAPVLYLLLQSVVETISRLYLSERNENISVFYAGNYHELRCYYKNDYDNFYKEINSEKESYTYYIKTDIRDFFGNINLNKLILRIDKIVNSHGAKISQNTLMLYKELLGYCGDGKFPLVENSVASSYLSTVVYLDEVDTKLFQFITDKLSDVKGFKMIRYVDDLYILFNSDKSFDKLKKSYNELINAYSSILKEYNLPLNTSKVRWGKSENISGELKKSLYDEYVYGENCEIAEFAAGRVSLFLSEIEIIVQHGDIMIDKYNKIIEQAFTIDGIEFAPNEVFNYFIFEDSTELKAPATIQTLERIIRSNINFIALDPKRLVVMIMGTKSNTLIKALLNQLFVRNHTNKWNSYDTTIAVTYLIQSKFQHIDLLNIIRNRIPDLYCYYRYFCKIPFARSLTDRHINEFYDYGCYKYDKKLFILYGMYLFEFKKGNILAAYAYYKNYFDRITSHIAFMFGYDKKKLPKYGSYYKTTDLLSFYNDIPGSYAIIKKADNLRNASPLSHASAELMDNDSTYTELLNSINELEQLAKAKVRKERTP